MFLQTIFVLAIFSFRKTIHKRLAHSQLTKFGLRHILFLDTNKQISKTQLSNLDLKIVSKEEYLSYLTIEIHQKIIERYVHGNTGCLQGT
jgi:hypothetical protein